MQRFLGYPSCISRPLCCRTGRMLTRCGKPKSRFHGSISKSQDAEEFGRYSVILPDEPFIFGTRHIRQRTVADQVVKPGYATRPDGAVLSPTPTKDSGKIRLGTHEEKDLRSTAALARKVREYAGTLVDVGQTTNMIDELVHCFIIDHAAYPSPLNYSGFPRSICTSVNNVLAHGIPDDRPLQDGDIVNIDVTVYRDGYHGDTSATFLVGNVDGRGRELVNLTNEALAYAIRACGPGKPFRVIGDAINDVIGDTNYCVSSQFTGHGVGRLFHSAPYIMHHVNDEPGIMEPGHCFTIEPIIIQGTDPEGWIFPDGWTASTTNCARSAQAEHMILITENGADVLTDEPTQ